MGKIELLEEALENSVNQDDGMSLVEYAESICPFYLSNFQKELIAKYEQAISENKVFYKSIGRGYGREFITKLVHDWEYRYRLIEHRCECGRLLGKFSGRAEIKCPKCGKMNVIGVGKQ